MKIILTGGVTGGHFYPLIAILQQIKEKVEKEKILPPKVYFFSPNKVDEEILFENEIIYKKVFSSPMPFLGIKKVFAFVKILLGTAITFLSVFRIYPDVVVSKGGWGSVPVLISARVLRIPIILHDSDTIPGRVTLWAAKFAYRVGIGFEKSIDNFPESLKHKVAYVGNPILKEHMRSAGGLSAGNAKIKLEGVKPLLYITGGSSGAVTINNIIIDSLNLLLEDFEIIHQTGVNNIEEVKLISNDTIKNTILKSRYHPIGYVDPSLQRFALEKAKLVITRAGANALVILAHYEKPAIIIPIPEELSRDQVSNAYHYASKTGSVVIEQNNLSIGVLKNEIDTIINNKNTYASIAERTKEFIDSNGEVLVDEIVELLKEHNS